MPFCTNCGSEVRSTDTYCGACGFRQASPAGAPAGGFPPKRDPIANLSPRTAAVLCYVPLIGWIAAIVVLASPNFSRDRGLRFHAFQGIYLFVAWLLIDWVLAPLLIFPGHGARLLSFSVHLLKLAVFGAWIWMLIRTSQNQTYSLPIVGELAERSVAEQR